MNLRKNLIPLALLLFFIATIVACNRGVGCPGSF